MCKFGVQVSRHSPQTGLPQLALWHHVGVTIGITLDKNGSLYDPAGTESCNVQIQKIRIAMLITEIKYQIATTVKWKYSCAVLGLAACHVSQNCNEKMQVRPAGQAGYPISLVASLDTVPVKCCVPLHYLKRENEGRKKKKEVLHLSRCYTHTLALFLSRPRSATTPKAHIKCLYAPDEWLWPAGLPQAIKQSKTLCIPASSESSRIYRTVCYGMSVTICYRIYIYISGFLGPGIRCQKVASLRLN